MNPPRMSGRAGRRGGCGAGRGGGGGDGGRGPRPGRGDGAAGGRGRGGGEGGHRGRAGGARRGGGQAPRGEGAPDDAVGDGVRGGDRGRRGGGQNPGEGGAKRTAATASLPGSPRKHNVELQSGAERRRSRRGAAEGGVDLTKRPAAPSLALLKQPDTTCLGLGLDTRINCDGNKQRHACCQNCVIVGEAATTKGKDQKEADKERAMKYACSRPWDPKYQNHFHERKRDNFHHFYEYFGLLDDDGNPITEREERALNRAEAHNESSNSDLDVEVVDSTPPPLAEAPRQPVTIDTGNGTTDAEVASSLGADAEVSSSPDVDGDELGADLLAAFASRKAAAEKDRWAIPCTVIDRETNAISDDATDIILENMKNRKRLSENELAICGALLSVVFKDQKKHKVAISPKLCGPISNRSFQVARIPTQYKTANTSRRLARDCKARLRSWLGVLAGNWDGVLLAAALDVNPKWARDYITDYYNKHMRLSPEQTTQLITFVRMNPTMTKRFVRMFKHQSGGLLPLAPINDVVDLRKEWIARNVTSLRVEKLKLEKKLKGQKGDKTASRKAPSRSVHARVAKVNPLELVLQSVGGLILCGQFVESSERIKTPFLRNIAFEDTACVAIKMDTGSSSVKGALCPVNVRNPQGTQHVKLFLEWDDAKDSLENCVLAIDPEMKFALEAIVNRRVIIGTVTIGRESRAFLVVNVGDGHDYSAPSPLPKFSGQRHAVRSSSEEWTQPSIEDCILKVDLDAVDATKLLFNRKRTEFVGVSFHCGKHFVAAAYFTEPIKCASADGAELTQYVLCGVFTSDLCFDSTIFGHQGARALWSCLFCLLNHRNVTACFTEHRCMNYPERTLAHIVECAKQYDIEFNSLELSKQTDSKRSEVTIGKTHSIVAMPALNFEIDDVTRAGMHMMQGIVGQIVEWTVDGLSHIESLEAGQPNGTKVEFKQTIETVLGDVKEYQSFLEEQLTSTKNHIKQQETSMKVVANAIIAVQAQMTVPDLSEADKETLEDRLDQLRLEQMQKLSLDDAQLTLKCLLLQQLCITKQTIGDLEAYHNKHEGHSTRSTLSAMRDHGVDVQVYFHLNILGNDCVTFTEKSEEIYDAILTNFSPCIEDPKNIALAKQFLTRMEAISALFYKLVVVIKSIKRQSEKTIEQFEKNTNDLRELIFDLVQFAEKHEMSKIQYPTKVKTHLLFDGCLLRQLKRWGTIGGLDEQSIEAAHALWNALMRQFGTTRGWKKKEMVLKEFLYRGADFIYDAIEEMLKETKRKKGPKARTAEQKAEALAERRRARRAELEEVVDLEDGDDEVDVIEPDLSNLEEAINQTPAIHPKLEAGINTHVKVCHHCSRHMLTCAFQIHLNEAHPTKDIVTMKKEEGDAK